MASGEEEELLVFGYACKVFRDDDRALQVDSGNFLVPWMGDPNLKIDRFDARGVLSDLRSYEALPRGIGREEYLSPEDVLVEEMCDDERYRSIKISDEAEAKFAQEEIDKRVEPQGAEIGFNYQQEASKAKEEPATASTEITLKQIATVIEKTSEFIATQGAQMEILMRAKEAHNPKFQFLNPGNPYHPIYKQVLEKKKARHAGRLLPNLPEVPTLEEVEQSLKNLARNLPSAAPGLSSQSASPANSYSKLVEKMRVNLAPPPPPPMSSTLPDKIEPPPPPPIEKQDDDSVTVQVPPYEEQILIDKTASYVCRLGGEKLGILRKRMPEKFGFLRSDNKYNTYYQFKVALYHEMRAERHREQKAKAVANANAATAALQDSTKHFPLLKGFFRQS